MLVVHDYFRKYFYEISYLFITKTFLVMEHLAQCSGFIRRASESELMGFAILPLFGAGVGICSFPESESKPLMTAEATF